MNFAYPTAEIAVMGAEGAVNILYKGAKDRDSKIAEYKKVRQSIYRRGARIRDASRHASLCRWQIAGFASRGAASGHGVAGCRNLSACRDAQHLREPIHPMPQMRGGRRSDEVESQVS